MQVLLHWDRGDNLFNANLVAGCCGRSEGGEWWQSSKFKRAEVQGVDSWGLLQIDLASKARNVIGSVFLPTSLIFSPLV